MARLLENQSKDLLQRLGIAVPRHGVARDSQEARRLAAELGKAVVLKALVPVGKRKKAGAIKFAGSPAEAETLARELLGMKVGGYPVAEVLVEERLNIARELYASLAIDRRRKLPVVIVSSMGGIDVEELSREHPDKVATFHVDPLLGLPDYAARQVWAEAGITGKTLQALAGVLVKLYKAFEQYDAYILEVNPLVITADGEVAAAATVMAVDDSAVYRHPELAGTVQMGAERAWRPLTDLERRVVEVNEADPYRGTARYTEMDGGDIGFMCGGGGGSLLLFDALVHHGGRPANYSEFGGNPPEDKVCGLARGILSKPGVKGLFVAQNITNNTQVDIVARGVVRALEEMKIDPSSFPVVVREAGVNEEEARRIFARAGVEYYGDEVTMAEAAGRMVERMREAYSGYGAEGGER